MINKILFFVVVVSIFIIFPVHVFAQQGCCSWHQGISYCDKTSGRYVCNDGTYSPSCTCSGGSYYSQPSCPPMSRYNSISEKCECYSGYIASGSRCISENENCQNTYGFNSSSDYTGGCKCDYGYVISNGKCVSTTSFCSAKLGYNSKYNGLRGYCECNYGYGLNQAGNRCISNDEVCKEQYGSGSKATLSGDKCECRIGYEWQDNECIFEQVSDYTPLNIIRNNTPTLFPLLTPTLIPTQKPTATLKPSPTIIVTKTPSVKGISDTNSKTMTASGKELSSIVPGISLMGSSSVLGYLGLRKLLKKNS